MRAGFSQVKGGAAIARRQVATFLRSRLFSTETEPRLDRQPIVPLSLVRPGGSISPSREKD
jgi:hypothetical protein